jgi:hypothetical protein
MPIIQQNLVLHHEYQHPSGQYLYINRLVEKPSKHFEDFLGDYYLKILYLLI